MHDAINTRTVNDLLDRFTREVLPTLSERTRKDYAYHVQQLRHTFGSRLAGELVKADIEEFLRVPEGVRGAIQRNRITAVLSSVLNLAIGWGWVTHNVCAYVRRNPASSHKRNLTEQEFEQARRLATRRIRAAMDLAMLTRQPQGNILKLRWDQVGDYVIRFRDPKVRKTRRKIEVDITPEIRAVLDECRGFSKKSEYVVCTRGGDRYTSEGFRSIWQRMMRQWDRAGNDRFNFHHIKAFAERRHAERQARKTELTSAVNEYPQFERVLCDEAAVMAEYYQVFYCLEQKIRRLIVKQLMNAAGSSWWDSQRVPTDTKLSADKLRQREVESGITPRSNNMIDYTSFGELSGIITSNWDVFESAFHNRAAISRVLHQLNLLRGPIAHCCAMSNDEIHRLGIAVKDWFRQVKA